MGRALAVRCARDASRRTGSIASNFARHSSLKIEVTPSVASPPQRSTLNSEKMCDSEVKYSRVRTWRCGVLILSVPESADVSMRWTRSRSCDSVAIPASMSSWILWSMVLAICTPGEEEEVRWWQWQWRW